jgi:hypothetical protein
MGDTAGVRGTYELAFRNNNVAWKLQFTKAPEDMTTTHDILDSNVTTKKRLQLSRGKRAGL